MDSRDQSSVGSCVRPLLPLRAASSWAGTSQEVSLWEKHEAKGYRSPRPDLVETHFLP